MKYLFFIPIFYSLQNNKSTLQVADTKDTVYLYTKNFHSCSWKTCSLKGQAILRSEWDKMDGNEYLNYFMDYYHFNNPSLTVPQVDSLVNSRFKYAKL
jgi:hypothetical protein